MTTMTEVETCSIEGCDTVVKSMHLCNKHYMQRWREEERELKKQNADTHKRWGKPSQYACDGRKNCKGIPDRWWAGSKDPKAMCPDCAERTLELLRLRIRALEVKQ